MNFGVFSTRTAKPIAMEAITGFRGKNTTGPGEDFMSGARDSNPYEKFGRLPCYR